MGIRAYLLAFASKRLFLNLIPFSCVFYGDLYPNDECYDANVSTGLKELMKARKNFAYGPQREYPVDKNCIGFVREGDDTHDGCAVLISNRDYDVDGCATWFFIPYA